MSKSGYPGISPGEAYAFPPALRGPTSRLLRNNSREKHRVVLLLQALRKAPPTLQDVLRAELRRYPHAPRLALLLSRWEPRSPAVVSGLIAALRQEVPPRGGMRGRGSTSYFAPESSNRWLVMQEKAEAKRILMRLPVDQPQVMPQLMAMLDAEDYETREVGVAAIRRFRSGALIALPKMAFMDWSDTRPQGRIHLVGMRLGLGFAVFDAARHILSTSLVDLRRGKLLPLLISTGSLLLEFLTIPRHGSSD